MPRANRVHLPGHEEDLRTSRNDAIERQLAEVERDPIWSCAAAIGDREFLEEFQESLGAHGKYKQIETWRNGEFLMDSARP